MLTYATGYLAALVTFVAADMVWLGTMAPRFYRPTLGDIAISGVNLPPAILFYAIYPVGVLIFAISPALKSDSLITAVSMSAFAQVPPDPNNPNEAIPDQVNVVPYGEPIKLADAKKAADAAMAEVAKRNWNEAFCVAVVNPAGELVYFAKGDNCQNASVTISQHKARTAARYRRPTVVFERLTGKGPFFAYLATLDDVIMSRGGNPLVVGGKLIGAIGVSGGTGSQDDTISQAGVAGLK